MDKNLGFYLSDRKRIVADKTMMYVAQSNLVLEGKDHQWATNIMAGRPHNTSGRIILH
jgi:hypothetical protein